MALMVAGCRSVGGRRPAGPRMCVTAVLEAIRDDAHEYFGLVAGWSGLSTATRYELQEAWIVNGQTSGPPSTMIPATSWILMDLSGPSASRPCDRQQH